MSEYPGDQREADIRAQRTNDILRGRHQQHLVMCPAYGNYQPPYEECTCGAESTMSTPPEPRGAVAPPRTPRQMVEDINRIAAHAAEPHHADVSVYIRHLLGALGQDVEREGLQDTPKRVAKFYAQVMRPEPVNLTTFKNEGMSEMIIQTGIPFYSLCEHHMVPFFGTAVVAYVPRDRIVGLSKLARLVQYHAAGLQNQERITHNVALALEALEPLGIGVLLKARHLCMEMRGIKVAGAFTTTSDLRGVLREESSARAEFLSLAR